MKGLLLLLIIVATFAVEKEDLLLVFNSYKYQVNVTDITEGTSGAPRNFRIYQPIGIEGKVPVIHFLHGFLLNYIYYDDMLTHLSSHGFIVISSQSEHKLIGGDTTIQESEKVYTFIEWLKDNLASIISVSPDFTNLGISGHSRGCKVMNRVLNSHPELSLSFFGVDPVDSAAIGDPKSLDSPVEFKGESMFIGTKMGREGIIPCAPNGDNSASFYANYPSPSHHIIAADVGHSNMIDQNDMTTCGLYCSICNGNPNQSVREQFIAYTGGLMAAFFSSTLKGETEYQSLLNDSSNHPFSTSLVEHK
jgi:chlorophyllase